MTALTAGRRSIGTWPTVAVLVVLWLATFAGQYWVFGVLFIAWAAWDIASGETNFVQSIRRSDSPVAFWAVELSWIGFGLLWILAPA